MQLHNRIESAQEQARELDELYEQLADRIAACDELQGSLSLLREQLHGLQAELQGIQGAVASLQGALPTVARREELEQLSRKMDAMPFERFATRKDL